MKKLLLIILSLGFPIFFGSTGHAEPSLTAMLKESSFCTVTEVLALQGKVYVTCGAQENLTAVLNINLYKANEMMISENYDLKNCEQKDITSWGPGSICYFQRKN